MPGANPFVWDLYSCTLSEVDASGWIRLQPDAYGEQGSDAIETLQPCGLLARPVDPELDAEGNVAQGCPMLVAWEGGKRMAIPMTDNRAVDKLPSLKKGEAMLYGSVGQFVRCQEDGSVATYTTEDATPTGRPVFSRVRPTGFEWESPYGRMRLDGSGFHVKEHGGARLDIGSINGMPTPLDSLSSYAVLQAQMVSLRGTIVSLGPDALPKDAVAKATPILTYLTALETALATAISAAGPGGPGAASAFSATMATAHGVLLAALPSQSTSVA